MLYTKYKDSRHCGFEQEDISKMFILKILADVT